MAFERYIIPEAGATPKMAIHLFVAILSEYLGGEKNAAETQAAIEAHLGISLDSDDQQDITELMLLQKEQEWMKCIEFVL